MTSNEIGLAVCCLLLLAALPVGVVTVALQQRLGNVEPGGGPTWLAMGVMAAMAAAAITVAAVTA